MIPGMDLPSATELANDFREHVWPPLTHFAEEFVDLCGSGSKERPAPQVCQSCNLRLKAAFPDGFAMEVTEVVCGPPAPVIVFGFRHVAKFCGTYEDGNGLTYKGVGQVVDVSGLLEARLAAPGSNEVVNVNVYYKPEELVRSMTGERDGAGALCPVSGKVGVCPVMDR
eukprot:CAMPEP_0117606148 /NCGR_PEP_ID=MMETSP0784-20121206/79561_1 /TAXON_ID=39447 /ORGANISM="" /LENGTH=168 /DNA_ID=CAMNT_0005409217 /DNA_START=64 /DNA_END=567 /DNA_ORIENTATION=+